MDKILKERISRSGCLRLLCSFPAFIVASGVRRAALPYAAEPLTEQAREALRRATGFLRSLATEGGYLWWYSADLKERAGENKATDTQIWVQSPGTPSIGMAFLRAYDATGERGYLQAAAEAARALCTGQLQSGGWDYRIDFDPQESRKWYRRTDTGAAPEATLRKRRNTSTFDDDNTQGALRFLMAYLDAAAKGKQPEPEIARIRDAVDYGLSKMLEAQYPNGAWPQRYDSTRQDRSKFPIRAATLPATYPREHTKENYYTHYTLNDDTQRDCIRTLLDAYRRLRKSEYLRAAKRGGDFLLLAQFPAPQSGWAQQYNTAMEPAWARAFEPPAASSRESAGVIRTLAELYEQTGDEKYVKPIPAAIAWLRRSEIAPNRWARFYELHTNRPIYGDRDGKIHYTVEELSDERRTGYAWQGTFGVASAIKFCEEAVAAKRPLRAAQKTGVQAAQIKPSSLKTREADAARAIAALDNRGRWQTNGRIETRTFIANAAALCRYLEAVKGLK